MGESTTFLRGAAYREFLTGQFAMVFAMRDGRDKPLAEDIRMAKIVADDTVTSIHHWDRHRKRTGK